jgi:DNA-binding NarL/FixJ family response regulator
MDPRAESLAVVLDAVVVGEPETGVACALERHDQAGDPWDLALASFAAVFAQRHEQASALALDGLEAASARPHDAELRDLARATLGFADAGWQRDSGVDPLAAAIEDPGQPPTTDTEIFARYLLVDAALSCARLDLAASLAERAGSLPRMFLENAGRPHPYLAVLAMTEVRLLVFRGKIDDAAAHHAQVSNDSGAPLVDLVVAATGSLVGGNAAERGTARSLADRIEQAHPDPRDRLSAGTWLLAAYGLTAVGDVSRSARTILLAGRGPDLTSLAIVDRALGFEMLVAAAALEGDLDIAEAWRARAEPLLDSPIANSTVARLNSRVELLRGDVDLAIEWADRAVELARAQGRVVEALEGEIVASRARIAATGDGGGTAHARLEAMVEEAEAAGHHAVRRSASRELRLAGRRLRPRAGSEWAGLSAREQAVAELLSAGNTNRQIATELHLSEHTVRIHVSRVLAAFGAGSRFAVATRLAELFPSDAPSTSVELTPRQRAVADRIALGWGNSRIASDLGISVRTIEKHLGDIRRRWGVAARAEIGRLAIGSHEPDAAPAPS